MKNLLLGSAWDEDAVDYDWDGERYIRKFAIGYGSTEEQAIKDLVEKLNS